MDRAVPTKGIQEPDPSPHLPVDGFPEGPFDLQKSQYWQAQGSVWRCQGHLSLLEVQFLAQPPQSWDDSSGSSTWELRGSEAAGMSHP